MGKMGKILVDFYQHHDILRNFPIYSFLTRNHKQMGATFRTHLRDFQIPYPKICEVIWISQILPFYRPEISP